MLYTSGRYVAMAGIMAACWPAAVPAQPATFTGAYTENFNSMGAAGTTPPAGWTVLTIAGDSNTWTNTAGSNSVPPSPGIVTAMVAGGTPSSGLTARLIDPANVAGNNNNGYNAATAASPDDRTLATAPTGVAGAVLELQLTNNTGSPLTSLTFSYDIRRLQVGAASGRPPPAGIPAGSEEIPGYWLFVSRDGTNYINVSQLNPVGEGTPPQVVVPNTLGVTTVGPTEVGLGGTWEIGSPMFFRWVDDNAFDPSPDQIFGLDNVIILTPVPEPSAVLAVSAAALLAGSRAVRRRFGAPRPAAGCKGR